MKNSQKSVETPLMCGCILRKPNFRQKMRILKQSHSVKKCKKKIPLRQRALGFFKHPICGKIVQKFSKKSLNGPNKN